MSLHNLYVVSLQFVELEHVTSRTIPPLPEGHNHGNGVISSSSSSAARPRGASLYWSRGAHGSGQAAAADGSDIGVVNNREGALGFILGCCGAVHAARLALHGVWWTWRIWIAPYAYLLFGLVAEVMSLLLSE